MTQDDASGIVALAAQTQQILVQLLRKIQFAAIRVIAGLPIGDVEELRGGAKLLPQLSCAREGMAHFRSRLTFDVSQRRAQGAAKFELLLLASAVVRQ